MKCKECNENVTSVSETAIAVTCSSCVSKGLNELTNTLEELTNKMVKLLKV